MLVNANHAMVKMTYDEVGMGAAQRLAGELPSPARFGALPWVMRGLLLIPILQIVDVVGALCQLRRWREDPQRRPSGLAKWGRHVLLPLIPNLSVALTLIPMLGKMRGFMMLFMPDYSWIAYICGSFALVWSFLRTGLVLGTLERPRHPNRSSGGAAPSNESSSHMTWKLDKA